MVVPSKSGEAPVTPIDVRANQTQISASLFGMDSPLFSQATIQYSQFPSHPAYRQMSLPQVGWSPETATIARSKCGGSQNLWRFLLERVFGID